MIIHAQESLFWPGIDSNVQQKRLFCINRDKITPLQIAQPPYDRSQPVYLFQQICCELIARHYGVVVDRFSNWFHVFTVEGSSKTLIKVLTWLCRDFGLPESLTSGPEISSYHLKQFAKKYGSEHRVRSAAFPRSSSRAEIAIKSAKVLLHDNILLDGELDTVKLTRAILTHRNTPDRATGPSPAQLLFGCNVHGFFTLTKMFQNGESLASS